MYVCVYVCMYVGMLPAPDKNKINCDENIVTLLFCLGQVGEERAQGADPEGLPTGVGAAET